MKKILSALGIMCFLYNVKSQTIDEALNDVDFLNNSSFEFFAGPSAAFAFGSYIDYQRSFQKAYDPNAEIGGTIWPKISVTLGGSARVQPFTDSILSNLSAAITIGFLQRGFKNNYHSDYTPPDADIKDKTFFREKQTLNYLYGAFSLRWGNKYFVDAGITYDVFLTGNVKHYLHHDVTGSDAYDGGFSTKDKDRIPYANNLLAQFSYKLIKDYSYGPLLGFECQLQNNSQVRLGFNYSGRTLTDNDLNYHNLTSQIQFIYPINISGDANK